MVLKSYYNRLLTLETGCGKGCFDHTHIRRKTQNRQKMEKRVIFILYKGKCIRGYNLMNEENYQ